MLLNLFVFADAESQLSIEYLVLKTVQRLVEQELAALMVGAALMLLVLIKYWDVPKKWTILNQRIIRIERRQKKLFEIIKIYFKSDKVHNFLNDNIDSIDDQDYYSEKMVDNDDN
ncbi:hypothetical protein NIES2100_05430 [Calothrix sp. NIES-2100]|uniref:hypothetical protein n=1 Tax=Calothrix sp. NIES-2100 TaxID=1954172 RepID=UPI000B5FB573|nr:hypothetical protein NIES2100_05430 [Calothrix sp. NIES-2100]